MATCHSVAKINEKFVGDPLDIKMFEHSKYDLKEVAKYTEVFTSSHRLRVLKVFDFSSQLMRMSSVVLDNSSNQIISFMKGSPEKIKQMVDPASLPNDFDEDL